MTIASWGHIPSDTEGLGRLARKMGNLWHQESYRKIMLHTRISAKSVIKRYCMPINNEKLALKEDILHIRDY